MKASTITLMLTQTELESLLKCAQLLTKVSPLPETSNQQLCSVSLSFTPVGSMSRYTKENLMHWQDTNSQALNGLVSPSVTEQVQP